MHAAKRILLQTYCLKNTGSKNNWRIRFNQIIRSSIHLYKECNFEKQPAAATTVLRICKRRTTLSGAAALWCLNPGSVTLGGCRTLQYHVPGRVQNVCPLWQARGY